MSRTIPDIINCKPEDNFTQVRNNILRDPNISLKAKGLLALLLSNKDGWYSYAETIKSFSTDGDTSIRTALRELEENKYLVRLKYRSIDNKRIRGGFWAYTDIPGDFNLQNTFELLKNNDYELVPRNTENPVIGFCTRRKSQTNNTNIKNTSYRKNSVSDEEKLTDKENKYRLEIKGQIKEVLDIPELKEMVTPHFIQSMKQYNPTKKELSYFIENFDESLLSYYKEYLIQSIIEEKLYKDNSNDMFIPRIALLNKNASRREQLSYAANNCEEIEYSLKSIIKKEEKVIDKDTKNRFLKNKLSFSDFIKDEKDIDIEEEEQKEKPIEYKFLDNLHKLDNKKFDYVDDEEIDQFIEELLV